MNSIQDLRDAFGKFRTEVPANPSLWKEQSKLSEKQSESIRLFSKALQACSHLELDPIEKRWNKLCYALVKEPFVPDEKFTARVGKIQWFLWLQTELQVRKESKNSTAEEVFGLVSSVDLSTLESKIVGLIAKNWICEANEMLKRVMGGLYGSSFKRSIQKKPRQYLSDNMNRLLIINNLLRYQNPRSDFLRAHFDTKDIVQIHKRLNSLQERLSKTCGLSFESIRELFIKDKNLVPAPVLQQYKDTTMTDVSWDMLRPYVDPSDEQLGLIAGTQTKEFPKKAFHIACRAKEDRQKIIGKVFERIARHHLDIAIELSTEFVNRDRPLYVKCSRVLAERLLEIDSDGERALPYIRNVEEEGDLVALGPLAAKKLSIEQLQGFVAQAKTVGIQAQLVEIVVASLLYSDAQKFIENLTDPRLKDLAYSSLVVVKEKQVLSETLMQYYEKIQDAKVRMHTLERLAANKSDCVKMFAKELKNESEKSYLVEQVAIYSGTLLEETTTPADPLKQFLLQQLVKVKKVEA